MWGLGFQKESPSGESIFAARHQDVSQGSLGIGAILISEKVFCESGESVRLPQPESKGLTSGDQEMSEYGFVYGSER